MKYTTAKNLLKRAMEGNKKYIEIGELLVCDDNIFHDGKYTEHEIVFLYFDGIAVNADLATSGIQYIMTYPKVGELTKEEKIEMQDYDGIEAPRVYTFRDCALCFGKLKEVEKGGWALMAE